jgi:hypothetical protein
VQTLWQALYLAPRWSPTSISLGLFLPAGIQLGVDDHATQNVPVQRCDANGCYAGLPVDASLLAALKAGKALPLTMRNMAQEPVTLEVRSRVSPPRSNASTCTFNGS